MKLPYLPLHHILLRFKCKQIKKQLDFFYLILKKSICIVKIKKNKLTKISLKEIVRKR